MPLTHNPAVSQYRWHHELKHLFVLALERYRTGEREVDRYFTPEQVAYLASIGQTPQEIYDFAEDHTKIDGPDWETVLLISAARRAYLLTVQRGINSGKVISMDDLPPKNANLDGIPWLPRLIVKAQAKLRGEMPPDLMFNCAGDRSFFREHSLDPADFLRTVWAADGDEKKILEYVRSGKPDYL